MLCNICEPLHFNKQTCNTGEDGCCMQAERTEFICKDEVEKMGMWEWAGQQDKGEKVNVKKEVNRRRRQKIVGWRPRFKNE